MRSWIAAHWYIPVAWFLVLNLTAFILMGADKARARESQWRISERALFLPAILGGAPGGYIGMKVFHHKTQKPVFRYGMPVLCVLYLIAYLALAAWMVMRR